MSSDPIVDEIERIRAELAAKCNYDLHEIWKSAAERTRISGGPIVSYPPRLAGISRVALPPASD